MAVPCVSVAADAIVVRGVVIDDASGKPLAGVHVDIRDAAGLTERATTDHRGTFSAVGLSPGLMTATVDGPFEFSIASSLASRSYSGAEVQYAVAQGEAIRCVLPMKYTPKSIARVVVRKAAHCSVDPLTQDSYELQ